MVQLSIIIVNYNVKQFVENCLHSFWNKTKEKLDFEVFIVDNNSSDGSVEYLRKKFPEEEFPELHIIANKENLGFGKANNQALALAKGEYILFLNPDTLLQPDTLIKCYEFVRSKENFGALGVKMCDFTGKFAHESKRGLPTLWASFCKMTGLSALFPKSKLFARYHLTYLDENLSHKIDIISGAFFFTKKSVLDKVGGFDENFFMYGEDIDLSYRIIKSGYSNYYAPFPIIHFKGESTKKTSYFYVKTFYDAMLIFYKKHYPRSNFLIALFIKSAIQLKMMQEYIYWKIYALFHKD